MQACATSKSTTHYGFFEAENSAGELRTFRIYWETIDVQGFNSRRLVSTPLVLEAQCSERAVRFYDANYRAQRHCMDADEPGIAFCGDPERDLDHRALPIENGKVCAYITDSRGAPEIKYLNNEISLIMRCQPKEAQVREGRKWRNRDYLKPSSIPYTITTKSTPGSEKDGHIPGLWNHSSVCDQNQDR